MPELKAIKAPIKRRKLYEDVVEYIEAAISAGTFQPGDQLPSERDLMALFGVGRPSIREALFALRRMGLVSLKAGERPRVETPTPAAMVNELSGLARHLLAAPGGVRHFQQARKLFERALAEYAAKEATSEDIDALKSALRANKQAISDLDEFQRTDVEFHFVIAQISRNPIVTALYTGLAEWLADQRASSIKGGGSVKVAAAAHAKIFAAIEAKDPIAAGEAMDDHLTQVEESYWGRMKRTAGTSKRQA